MAKPMSKTTKQALIVVGVFAAIATIVGAFALGKNAVPTNAAEKAVAQMKLANLWRYEIERFENCSFDSNNGDPYGYIRAEFCGEPYLDCNYTSKTCQKGYHILSEQFVFAVLAEDRETELNHLICIQSGETWCISFDTGLGRRSAIPESNPLSHLAVSEDMPSSCVDFTQDRLTRLSRCQSWIERYMPGLLAVKMRWPRP